MWVEDLYQKDERIKHLLCVLSGGDGGDGGGGRSLPG